MNSDIAISSTDLGEATHMGVVDQLLSISGQFVVDVGSGDGNFSKALAGLGAQVLAIEPDKRETPPELPSGIEALVTFECAGGEAIPLDDGQAHGVFFNRSLHHVPGELMDQALEEARRVLDLDSGFLYVIEPDMSGAWSQLMKPFHDETDVRRRALEALDRTASRLFADEREYWYKMWMRFKNFEEFATQPMMKKLRLLPDDVETPQVRALFGSGETPYGFEFAHPMRLRIYRGAI